MFSKFDIAGITRIKSIFSVGVEIEGSMPMSHTHQSMAEHLKAFFESKMPGVKVKIESLADPSDSLYLNTEKTSVFKRGGREYKYTIKNDISIRAEGERTVEFVSPIMHD